MTYLDIFAAIQSGKNVYWKNKTYTCFLTTSKSGDMLSICYDFKGPKENIVFVSEETFQNYDEKDFFLGRN